MDNSEPCEENLPVTMIVIGMAGSGKTTMMKRLCSEISKSNKKSYVINLDPAVLDVNYPANIDIRDTVDYRAVMDEYQLGPNGGIMTTLNLFTTKFGKVLDYIDKRVHGVTGDGDAEDAEVSATGKNLDYVLLDTPGQIEIFTWSASGQIITESLAAEYPTVIVYVIDSTKASSPSTFISNMLYACSILYKSKLPFVVALNKSDECDTEKILSWIRDFEKFHEAAQEDTSFMGSLITSMSLVLDEFYNHLRVVSCSALTGVGMDDFFKAVDEAAKEYEEEYKPDLQLKMKKREEADKQRQEENLERLIKDLNVDDSER
jgi:GTPase SAR1 family protein